MCRRYKFIQGTNWTKEETKLEANFKMEGLLATDPKTTWKGKKRQILPRNENKIEDGVDAGVFQKISSQEIFYERGES